MARGGGVAGGRRRAPRALGAAPDRPRYGVLPRELLARRERPAAARAEPRRAGRVHHLLRPGGRRAAARRAGPAMALGAVVGGAARREPALRSALGRSPSGCDAGPSPHRVAWPYIAG